MSSPSSSFRPFLSPSLFASYVGRLDREDGRSTITHRAAECIRPYEQASHTINLGLRLVPELWSPYWMESSMTTEPSTPKKTAKVKVRSICRFFGTSQQHRRTTGEHCIVKHNIDSINALLPLFHDPCISANFVIQNMCTSPCPGAFQFDIFFTAARLHPLLCRCVVAVRRYDDDYYYLAAKTATETSNVSPAPSSRPIVSSSTLSTSTAAISTSDDENVLSLDSGNRSTELAYSVLKINATNFFGSLWWKRGGGHSR